MATIRFAEIQRAVKRRLAVYRAIYADKRTPRLARWLLWGALLYLATPIDIIPDFIPVLGYLDDLLIVPGLIYLALRLVPQAVYSEHADAIAPPPPSDLAVMIAPAEAPISQRRVVSSSLNRVGTIPACTNSQERDSDLLLVEGGRISDRF
jgi:uncharacterized membrane protein YkvA (DUF1232 family)